MLKLSLAIAACALLSACASSTGLLGGPGTYIYSGTDSKKGLVTQIESCGESAVVASPQGYVGPLQGASTRHSVLGGLVTWGSSGTGDAAQKGGITRVDTVEQGGISVLWGTVYRSNQTIVTGDTATVYYRDDARMDHGK